ncbi:M20/M25/M40 family metallo-hydrolase [Enterovirga sp.]|jgi:acetylornithine deacetylase|uniref:M20/M25/M40 family metallo-hydrolase n=1 Tax=Enterovirga sp. TaxID=2026350 RepID=UPI00261249CD|nr:M20/M25/M40 family metallo-hydrolase [Enterovirga sp.]MDB5592416.1 acetylornithine deacetylase [Enterovirga sp.]
MTDLAQAALALASDLVRMDSRSFVSNIPIADRIEAELRGFEIERLDYLDEAGTPKRALVARRGPPGGLAFSGHMDTVPDTGWVEDPWSGKVADGLLYGLGSADMKGQTAAAIVAARALPDHVPAILLLTTDEETTKGGARAIAERSELARGTDAILVVEPTSMVPMRGHRAHVQFTATATGVQAHSSTGRGRNANWDLVPFLTAMRKIHERLHRDPALQDPAYDPVFSDFNLIIDNHGTAVNVSVPRATATIKFRYSASVDPAFVVDGVRAAARRFGLALAESWEGRPPELAPDHPFVRLCSEATGETAGVAPYGTDAAELQAIAPCVLLGPGSIAVAHRPNEALAVCEIENALPVFMRLAEQVAEGRLR